MLAHGTPVEYNKIGSREISIPVRNKSGGIIGLLRILFVGAEILLSFIPGLGTAAQIAIGLAGAAAQATLTGVSYAQGNIRSLGQLFGALALDIIPALSFGLGGLVKSIRTEAIAVEDIGEAINSARLNKLYIRGTTEFKENLSILKAKKISKLTKVSALDGTMTRTVKLSGSKLSKYRNAYLKEQAKLGEDTSQIVFDNFEVRLNSELANATNADRALVRNIKSSKNLLSRDPIKYQDLIEGVSNELSPQLQGYLRNLGRDPRKVIDGLIDYTESRRLTSRLNKIFASGESDWASRQFWKKDTLKSSNFYTQAAQALNANDVGREIITKPFNALIRKNKEFVEAYHKKWVSKWLKKYGDDVLTNEELMADAETKVINKFTFAGKYDEVNGVKVFKHEVAGKTRNYRYRKAITKQITKQSKHFSKTKKLLEKEGKWFGGSFVLGYRILQNVGMTKTIMIYFNKINTNANRAGSKNRGGKKEVILPITDHKLKEWNHSANKSSWYLRNLSLSRGGRPIGYSIQSELFSNFLSFVPLPALRNILSVVSNFKSVGKDISKGTYFKNWFKNFEETVQRLWIHKVGKLAGSSLGILGHGAGKEGQRLGLGIARSFQHNGGQRLGSFNSNVLLKTTLPTSFKGTALRRGQNRASMGLNRTASQAKLSVGRYGSNIRRIAGIPKL